MRLSYSKLNSWQTCRLLYRFQYLERLPTQPKSFFSLGHSVHAALKKWNLAGGDTPPSKEDLLKFLDESWERKGYRDERQETSFKEDARIMLSQYWEAEASRFRKPILVEDKFTIPMGAHEISGIIDLVVPLPDGSVEIIDYKTAKRPPKENDLASDLQLSMYALAAISKGHRVSKLSLYMLRHGEAYSTSRTSEQLSLTEADLLREGDAMQNVSDFPPNVGAHCKWCDFRDQCPAFGGETGATSSPNPFAEMSGVAGSVPSGSPWGASGAWGSGPAASGTVPPPASSPWAAVSESPAPVAPSPPPPDMDRQYAESYAKAHALLGANDFAAASAQFETAFDAAQKLPSAEKIRNASIGLNFALERLTADHIRKARLKEASISAERRANFNSSGGGNDEAQKKTAQIQAAWTLFSLADQEAGNGEPAAARENYLKAAALATAAGHEEYVAYIERKVISLT